MSLEEKVRQAREVLREALAQHQNPAVSWSGGKDSTALLHLALQERPGIPVVWNNTLVEFPETYRFIRQVADAWHLNLHIARPAPGITFWSVVERYGYPMLGKDWGGRGGYGPEAKAAKLREMGEGRKAEAVAAANLGTSCCDYLKERPFRKKVRELGADCNITGLMASESHLRHVNFLLRGSHYWSSKARLWKAHPLSTWEEADIWEYTRAEGLPVCRLYSMGYRRNGCWPCLMGIQFGDNKLAAMRLAHPKLWRFLILDYGLGKRLIRLKLALSDGQLDMFVHRWGDDLERLLAERPCFFDRV